MAELFLDIRNRQIRAILAESGEKRFQHVYPLERILIDESRERTEILIEGELANIIAAIRSDAGLSFDRAHIILPPEDVHTVKHRLQHMPQQEAYKLLMRKTAEESGEETPHISLVPMEADQNSQTWLSQYVPAGRIKFYIKELRTARVRLRTVTSALDATLASLAAARESIFNAHAVFEIHATSLEAYYISSSNLLLHETLPITIDEEFKSDTDPERIKKRRIFAILDLLYRINSKYLSAHPMLPLQKVWLCGTDPAIGDLALILQEAMSIETALLSDNTDDPQAGCPFTVLNGFLKAFFNGTVNNLMSTDRFQSIQLRKKSGRLIFAATLIITLAVVTVVESKHARLKQDKANKMKELSTLKVSKASSASFAKNLDLLKRISSRQVALYPVFRELAMRLPEGIYLDSVEYLNKEGHNTIAIAASFSHSHELGNRKVLTQLMSGMAQSPYLVNLSEPTVSIVSHDKSKTVVVKFNCEVEPRDTPK